MHDLIVPGCELAGITRPRHWTDWHPAAAESSAVVMYDREDGFIRDATDWDVLAASWESDARLYRRVVWAGGSTYHFEYYFNPQGWEMS